MGIRADIKGFLNLNNCDIATQLPELFEIR